MSTDSAARQAEHAARFGQIARNLKRIADELVREHPDFGKDSFGRAFLAAAIYLLLEGVGQEATAAYLIELGEKLDAGDPPDLEACGRAQ